MFSFFVVYLAAVLVCRLRSQTCLEFFTQVWNWVDLFVVITALAQSALYVTCVVTATEQVDDFLSDRLVPSPLGVTILLHGILRWTQGLLVFLLCFKIVRQVRFCRPLYKFYITLSTASGPLLAVMLIFTVLLLIYAQFGYLLYSSSAASFRSLETSLGSLVGVLGSRTDFSPLFDAQRVLTHLFFLSFVFVAYGVALSLSLAVLSWSLKRSREQMSYKTTLDTRDYEMIDFMLKRFRLMAGIDKPKPAFRHVKFAGLPSLPSRATSSNMSSRQSCRLREDSHLTGSSRPSITSVSRRSSLASDSAISSDDVGGAAITVGYSLEMNEELQSMDYLMASVLPTWEQVLRTLQKVEDLDKNEDESVRHLQDAVKKSKQPAKWATQRPAKFKLPNTKPIMGKPPLDPKATFARFKGHTGSRSITVLAGRNTMTPPSTFASDNALGQYASRNLRPFSDQGIRHDPKRFLHLSSHQDQTKGSGDNHDYDDTVDVIADVEEIMSKCRPSYGRPPSSVFAQRRQSGTPDQTIPPAHGFDRRRHSTPPSASSAGSSSTGLRRGSPDPGFFNESTRIANTTSSGTNSASSVRSDIDLSKSNNIIDSSSSNKHNSSSSHDTNKSYRNDSSKKDTNRFNKVSTNASNSGDRALVVGLKQSDVRKVRPDKLPEVPDIVPGHDRQRKRGNISGSFTAR
ncbi:hypothetical protein EGW08_020254 [Elysia chlorotica]|uniref:Polycystin cation channel PKD1/PKD2 domain-containing protein n=1 Tax=Elysia chlorotica TaxID=188477 RepID=A0A433SRY7_ELYCH|nr:hypothetical protein EGW08_020254 [Elysia chlorotica]